MLLKLVEILVFIGAGARAGAGTGAGAGKKNAPEIVKNRLAPQHSLSRCAKLF